MKGEDIVAMATLIVAVITLILVIRVPKRVMIDQRFMSLTTQYRSPEMGFAIHCLCDFFKNDCQNDPKNIKDKYIERFEKEIKCFLSKNSAGIEPSKTLHFQRRLVAYYFWDLARLSIEPKCPRLGNKKLLQMVEENELNLISLVLHMSEASKKCSININGIGAPPEKDEVPMNEFLRKLYYKAKRLLPKEKKP